jgi:hypothetical protein
MKTNYVVVLLLIAFVTANATGSTGGAAPEQTKTTEERVVQLEAELLALSKENNLLTDTLKNNWNAFKTTCGAVLTSKCADIAKESEEFVEMHEERKEHYSYEEHGEHDGHGDEHDEHGDEHDGHDEHERHLRGDRHHDDDKKGHHGGKRHGGKHHGGKHHGGKHHMPEPPVVGSIKCVLKQSHEDEKSVPLHCVRSAKRFGMYLKINRPSNVVVVMPRRHHVDGWGIFIPILLLCAIIGCCFRCVRRMRRSKCPVHLQHQRQGQSIQQAQIVLGQPVVVTTTTETEKV